MSNDNFEIGTANYDKRGGMFGKKYFYIKPNEPNIYRVLPPVLSLARTQEYFKYHQIHRNMRATDGKQRALVCTKDVDYKTKIVRQRCPVCDRRREYELQYETIKKQVGDNPTADQKQKFQEFWMAFIEPLKVERQFYMNVLNQAGEIGILPIPSTLKNAMQAYFKRLKDEEGVDAAGVKGIFVNFSKVSQYKGDNKPAYGIEPQYEQFVHEGKVLKTYKVHEITPEFVNKMKTDCRDLASLHRLLQVEELAQLAAADRESRKKLLDALFTMPEDQDDGDAPTANIPGVVGATAVGHATIGPNGMQFSQPVIQAPPAAAPAPQPTPAAAPAPAVAAATAAFFAQPAQTASANAPQPAQATPAAAGPAPQPAGGPKPGASSLSDQDFLKLFQNMGVK